MSIRERDILAAIRAAHPTMRFGGFKGAVLCQFGERPGVVAAMDCWHYVPDCFRLTEEGVLQVFEVVVWHEISTQKLNAYGDLKQTLGRAGVTMELWRVASDGSSVEIELAPLATHPQEKGG